MLERTINGTEAEDQALQLRYQKNRQANGLPIFHTYLLEGVAEAALYGAPHSHHARRAETRS